MNLLAMDTSSPLLSLALRGPSGKIREATTRGFMTHAENLIPMLDRLLKKEKISMAEIHAFLIDRGPGSFTGLRIGFATLKGFLTVKKRKCFGALSLDMIAENISPAPGKSLAVALDAYRGKIYSRFYLGGKEAWKPQGKPLVLSIAETAEKLTEGIFVTGNALERYQKEFKTLSGKKKIRFLASDFWYPKASVLIRWHVAKDLRLVKLEKPADLLPRYFRLSEAEEQRRSLVPPPKTGLAPRDGSERKGVC